MALTTQTKLQFAATLEEMLQTTPMDKIRITALCKKCGTIPQTFYYHFHDKYELVAWIFRYDFAQVYNDTHAKFSPATITANLTQMAKRRLFYQKTYSEHAQNSIDQYIQRFNVQTASQAIEAYFERPVTKQQLMHIKYHSYGMMGLFKEWLKDDTTQTITEIAAFQYALTPDFLRKAYQNYAFEDFKISPN